MHPSILDTSIIDLLEADPRPSVIVALTPHPPTVVYTNPAFAGFPTLLDLITSKSEGCRPLWEWITGGAGVDQAQQQPSGSTHVSVPESAGPAASASFSYSNVYWTRSVVHEQMVVVGANEQLPLRLTDGQSQSSRTGGSPKRVMNGESEVVAGGGGGAASADDNNTENRPAACTTPTITPIVSVTSVTEIEPCFKSTRSTSTTSPKERPPSRAEAVQSLGHAISDPAWILPDITPEQRPFLDDINSVDWAKTPLGPMHSWHRKLDETVNQILVDSRPHAVYWGPTHIMIYNEAFSKFCGLRHPSMLGMPVLEAWAEAGEIIKDTMRGIAHPDRDVVEHEWRFYIDRESEMEGGAPWLEETYLRWSMIPILENGQCLGYMQPVAETTSVRLWKRRDPMLEKLHEILVTVRDVESYWEKAMQGLASLEPQYDIPLAILYTVEEDPEAAAVGVDANDAAARKACRLVGSLGVPPNHPIAPDTIKLGGGGDGCSSTTYPLISSFRETFDANHPTLLQTSDGTLPPSLLDNLQWRGFEGDPCRAAVICPIRPIKEDSVAGFLFLGLNPRRPYDNDYRHFISLLTQRVAASLASIVRVEEEARRGRNAAEQAASDQAMLKQRLEVQTKEANESLQMFEAVAEFVPVGMSFGDPEGNITYANDAWYKITGYPGTGPVPRQGFLSCVKDQDHHIIIAEYEKLKTTRNVEFEFRVKRQPTTTTDTATDTAAVATVETLPSSSLTRSSPSFGEAEEIDLVSLEDVRERNVLASARAEYSADGRLMRVLTCLTDVSPQKSVAREALRRAQQAENLRRMAEFATVGLYDMTVDGRLLGANTVFFEMCGLRKVDPACVDVRPWQSCVCKEDLPLLTSKLDQMVREDKVQNVEIRLNTTWTTEDGSGHKVVMPRWVQATLLPVRSSSEGTIQSFTGCLSDVSLQKYQLEWEKERKEEAIESKRQQENFIDMTSHEMRNPLSAIIHCADAITATLCRVQELLGGGFYGSVSSDQGVGACAGAGELPVPMHASEDWAAEARELVENCIDNAETIVSCANHQRRIVDDILTMSKLDSSLISITRVIVDPIKMVKEALKMFEVEARRVDINLSMVVDPGYHELGIKHLIFDPSRLKQVLINLLTNALKFTVSVPTRNVTVAVSASLSEPTEASSKVSFIPRSEESLEEMYDQPAPLDRANPVFLMFEVEDTGEGLTEEEKNNLFQRFVQASGRTHIKYGGSGLGLFISRRLTELQHGAIGVSSQPGVGSTFALYIEAYRPTDEALREMYATEAAGQSALSALRFHPSLSRRSSNKRAISSSTLASEFTLPTAGSAGSVSGPSTSATTAVTPSSEVGMGPSLGLSLPSPPQIKGVLVVEDNLINQQITRRGLLSMGFTVDVANHGVEALEKLCRTDRYAPPGSAGGFPFSGGRSLSCSAPGKTDADADTITTTNTTTAATTPTSPTSPAPPPTTTLNTATATSMATIAHTLHTNPLHTHTNGTTPTPGAPGGTTPHPFPLSMILMDIEMPIQDGLTCTRHIRELERAGHIVGGRIPIIAVSANARKEQIREARQAGCDDVLVKPYRMPELLERMRVVMGMVVGAGDAETEEDRGREVESDGKEGVVKSVVDSLPVGEVKVDGEPAVEEKVAVETVVRDVEGVVSV
ncbi:hypothetical protein B0J18DRAFT_102331 [Chaetomium sp. MPI-SDFR-AT-0129]|nr:hypothetical protein B0J18DRAFT_102331 [Chaetomium sp. MPI-SDFR-AT-0129]